MISKKLIKMINDLKTNEKIILSTLGGLDSIVIVKKNGFIAVIYNNVNVNLFLSTAELICAFGNTIVECRTDLINF